MWWCRAHLSHWPVCFQEVRLQVRVEQVAGDALNRIIDGQNMNSLPILNVGALQKPGMC